jgi:hypothetical protein
MKKKIWGVFIDVRMVSEATGSPRFPRTCRPRSTGDKNTENLPHVCNYIFQLTFFDICDVHYGSRYMKSVVYHAPKTALENVEVIFGL